MQKIKYPVGSVIKTKSNYELKIIDLSKNEYACLVVEFKDEKISSYYQSWMTQEQLDRQGYTIVSSPPWKPEIGQEYWYMMSDGDMDEIVWENKRSDIFRLKSGNVFRSENEVRIKRDEINSREI